MNLAPIPSLLLELSLLGSLFALFVLLMRGLGRKWLPAGLFTLAWLLVGLRLLSPVTPDSPLSLLNVRPSLNRFMARQEAETPVILQENPAPWMNIDPLPETIVPSESAPTDRSPDPLHLASAIWLAGFLGLSGLSLLGHLRFSRKLSTTDQSSAPAPSDRLERLLKEAAEVTGLRRPLPLRFSHDIHGPCLCGIFRPAIVLPVGLAASLNDQDVRLIFQHEMTHARRRDPWLHGLLGLAAVCHWFNPVAWWARRACRQDCELATDAALIRTSTSQDRGNYARLLLDVARLSRNQRSRSSFFIRHSALPFALPMASSRSLNLKHRITMINHPHKKHPLARFSALVLLGLATLAVGTNAEESKKDQSKPSANQSVPRQYQTELIIAEVKDFETLEEQLNIPDRDAAWDTFEPVRQALSNVNSEILSAPRIITEEGKQAVMSIGNISSEGKAPDALTSLHSGLVAEVTVHADRSGAKKNQKTILLKGRIVAGERIRVDKHNMLLEDQDNEETVTINIDPLLSHPLGKVSIFGRSDSNSKKQLIAFVKISEHEPTGSDAFMKRNISSVSFKNLPAREAFRSLLKLAKEQPNDDVPFRQIIYQDKPRLEQQSVTMDLKNLSLEQCLKVAGELTGYTYRIKDGVLQFYPVDKDPVEMNTKLSNAGSELSKNVDQEGRWPRDEHMYSSTVRKVIKPDETLLTGGFEIQDGHRVFVTIKPRWTTYEGVRMIKEERRVVHATPEQLKATGLETMITNDENIIQHGEVRKSDTLERLLEKHGMAITEIPYALRPSISRGGIEYGDYKIWTTPYNQGNTDGDIDMKVEIEIRT